MIQDKEDRKVREEDESNIAHGWADTEDRHMDKKYKAPVDATWQVQLMCDCPRCGEYVDLLDAPDFWDGRRLDIPEHGTERSRNVDVFCPECHHGFYVNCCW